eukprot:3915541-Amphidinium_carterae.2
MIEEEVPNGLDFPVASQIVAYLCVYVDDLLLCASDEPHAMIMCQLTEVWKTSEPKVLGLNCDSLTYLGIVVCYESEGSDVMVIHQIPYIHDMLDKYQELVPFKMSKQPGMSETSADHTAVDESRVTESQINRMRAALGAILWVVTRTRPDLAWSHSMCATTLSTNPAECLKRIRQLFGYLCANDEMVLRMTSKDDRLRVYTDSSFAPSGGKSHAGLLLQLGEASITWRSHKQSLVALSTGEAELYASVEGIGAVRSARSLLLELGLSISVAELLCDNSAAIALSNSDPPMRSRHWSMRSWRLREAVRSGEVAVSYVSTDAQRADSFTKALSCNPLQEHRLLMGLVRLRESE